MARTTAAKPNSLVASAARVNAGRRRNDPQKKAWQDEAWDLLDAVGELEFYRLWVANTLSMCTLSVVEVTTDTDGHEQVTPTTDPTALAALAALFNGSVGQSGMLSALGSQLAIPGESYLVGILGEITDPTINRWRVLSRDEITQQGTKWVIDRGDGAKETYLDGDDVFVARIWDPHPRRAIEANSSVRSAIPILRQIIALGKRDGADLDSRLKGEGALLVPTETTIASAAPHTNDDPNADPFLVELMETMMEAKADQGSASATVPLIIKAPGQYLDKIRHLRFSTDLDTSTDARLDRNIQRLANSLNVPAEVLLGLGDVNHWGAWLIDANAIKMHVEPRLLTITTGLTTSYLWPCLQGTNPTFNPALTRFRIIGSTAALREPPNHSTEARDLHTNLTITDAALIRETGLNTDDLLTPTTPEYARRILQRLTLNPNPQIVAAALDALGTPVPGLDSASTTPALGASTSPGNPEIASTPNGAKQPIEQRREIPTMTASAERNAAVLAASEVLVHRAVERAWNKAGRRGAVRRPVPAESVDAAMARIWEQVPRTAALLGLDPVAYQSTLDRHTRELLLTGRDYTPGGLAAVLSSLTVG